MRTQWMLGLVALFCLAAAREPAPVTLSSLAGRYYQGDGLGVNFTLSVDPDGTFAYAWDGCLGRYATARGRASLQGEELVLDPSTKEGDVRLPPRLHILHWGERIYLVAADEFLKLANAMNHGEEPRTGAHGFFYLRARDWERTVTGAPELPASSLAVLLPHPVEGQILRLVKETAFEIDLGTRNGLKPGLDLFARGKTLRYGLCHLTVVSVSEDSATVHGDEDCKKLRAGMKVCSRLEACYE